MGPAQPPRLFDRIRECLRLKHYSYRTEQQYLHWIRRYILFHDKRHPKEMGADEVRGFLNDLTVARNVSAALAIRDLTVPIGMPRRSAISEWVKPSRTSRITSP